MAGGDTLVDEYVNIAIATSDDSFSYEKKFLKNINISNLKGKLELITGCLATGMTLTLYIDNKVVATLDNAKNLDDYLPEINETNKVKIEVKSSRIDFGDTSEVKKFEISDEEYSKRSDSVRAFKMKIKTGGESENMNQKETDNIQVNDRCQVKVNGQPTRRGRVAFIGSTQFKPGTWVGVEYDEPLGKNDGSVDGIRYFDCKQKYGAFVKPSNVETGDFPEEGGDLMEL